MCCTSEKSETRHLSIATFLSRIRLFSVIIVFSNRIHSNLKGIMRSPHYPEIPVYDVL